MNRSHERGLPLRRAVALIRRATAVQALVPAVRLTAGDLPLMVRVDLTREQGLQVLDDLRALGHRRADVAAVGDLAIFGWTS